MKCFVVLASFISISAFAQTPPKSEVIFFGGHGAKMPELQKWVDAASNSNPYGAYLKFRAIPFAGKASNRKASMAQNGKAIDEIVKEINADKTGKRFVLAGHSSGSASTFNIAAKIDPSKYKQVVVINLDGFTPREVPKGIETKCWTARDLKTKVGTENSVNMERCGNSETIVMEGCNSRPNCLHNSLVHNLRWLNREIPTATMVELKEDPEAGR